MTGSHRTRPARGSVLVRCREILLTLGAAVGALCIVMTIAGIAFDVRALVFRSGSMEPEISTGALAFARSTPASDLEVGDVVSVIASNGTRVTHRITSIDDTGRMTRLTLKGDANRRPDAEPYDVTAADRVVADVPYVGYAIGYASTPVGIFTGGLLAGGLLWLVVRPSRRTDGKENGRRRAVAAGAVAVIAVTGAAAQAPVSTLAYFNDTGTVDTGTASTHTVVSQAQPVCTTVAVLGLLDFVRMTWTHVDARYEYQYEIRQAGTGTVARTGVATPTTAAGTTVTLELGNTLITANGNYDVALRARLKGSTTWVAGTETVTKVHGIGIAFLGLAARCGYTP